MKLRGARLVVTLVAAAVWLLGCSNPKAECFEESLGVEYSLQSGKLECHMTNFEGGKGRQFWLRAQVSASEYSSLVRQMPVNWVDETMISAFDTDWSHIAAPRELDWWTPRSTNPRNRTYGYFSPGAGHIRLKLEEGTLWATGYRSKSP